MKTRELAGAINRAKTIYVWVRFAENEGIFLEVSKPNARHILEAAKTKKVITLASIDAGDLYIGAPATKVAREEEE
jgi:hypothetical protein